MVIGTVNSNNTIYSSGERNPNIQKEVKEIPALANDSSEKIISKKELDAAVTKANKVLFKNNTHLKFEIHDVTKDVMVKIIDDESGEVVKEIPAEKMLDMVAKLWEIAGILVDEKR